MEFGNPHEHMEEVADQTSRFPFDIVIASVHWLDDRNIHGSSCFDGANPHDVYAEYFRVMTDMVWTAEYDMLAHFDRIFATGSALYGPPEVEQLEEEIRPVLEALVSRDRVLELNSRFLKAEPGWNDGLVTVLRWYREAGGSRVEINSDAHRTGAIGRNRSIGETLLTDAGFSPRFRSAFEAGPVAAD